MSRCPSCQKVLPKNVPADVRPFCTPRCRTIDLGRWLNEEYRIAGDDTESDVATPIGRADDKDK